MTPAECASLVAAELGRDPEHRGTHRLGLALGAGPSTCALCKQHPCPSSGDSLCAACDDRMREGDPCPYCQTPVVRMRERASDREGEPIAGFDVALACPEGCMVTRLRWEPAYSGEDD